MESTTGSTLAATPLHVRDVVRIPSGAEAVVESIDLESSTAVCAWDGTRSTFPLVDLVWLQRGAPAPDPSGDPSPPADTTTAATDEDDDARSITERVKAFFEKADEDVKEAFHGEVLGKIDQLGQGATLVIDSAGIVTISSLLQGARYHGHGPSTAAALADLHTQLAK